MSQEKTSVPGMENSYYANKKNNMYRKIGSDYQRLAYITNDY